MYVSEVASTPARLITSPKPKPANVLVSGVDFAMSRVSLPSALKLSVAMLTPPFKSRVAFLPIFKEPSPVIAPTRVQCPWASSSIVVKPDMIVLKPVRVPALSPSRTSLSFTA
jgi:hypothetical protein